MDIESYKRNFQLSCINENTDGWEFDYFLKFDDQQGSPSHTIKVKNTHDTQQAVHVGAHVWQDRTYGWYDSECYNAAGAWHKLTN